MFIRKSTKKLIYSLKNYSSCWRDIGSEVVHSASQTKLSKPFFLWFGICVNPSNNFQSTSEMKFNTFEQIKLSSSLNDMIANNIANEDYKKVN
jgi:hypothetical protein